MINFSNLRISRAIMHTINEKLANQDHASADVENELVELTDEVAETIINRLIDAAGRNSRAFELELENVSEDSFYSYARNINNLADNEFIDRSKEIAYLLADSQKRSNIPGGYLVILDTIDTQTQLSVFIVIKAEPHNALRIRNQNGHTAIELLERVFLSPSQKFYKIGILYEKNRIDNIEPNQKYGCFLFDDQFRPDSQPAEYFYKDFLGFSVDSNAKIQCKRFYDKTESFIKTNIQDFETKKDILHALRTEFTVNQDSTINPHDFGRRFFPEDLFDEYNSQVIIELPSSFVKDTSLLEFRLKKRKMDFPNNIYITGPEEIFDQRVQVLNTQEEISNLSSDSNNYTILKILGKPFSDE